MLFHVIKRTCFLLSDRVFPFSFMRVQYSYILKEKGFCEGSVFRVLIVKSKNVQAVYIPSVCTYVVARMVKLT